jgi:hypothetical protein
MKLIRTTPHEKYNCDKIIEIFTPEFCARAHWDEENNYTPRAEGEHAYVVADDALGQVGWRVRDGVPIPPDTPVLEDVKIDKTAEIAAARFAEETGGLVYSGMKIDTSRESQALITGAALQATMDSGYACHWKTGAGFVELDAAAILAVAVAVRTHVQACFDKEAGLLDAVTAAGTIEEAGAIEW